MASVGLNIGLRGLLAAQAALDTVGHNVANVNTPGYSRQTLHLAAQQGVQVGGILIGRGVNAEQVVRTVDDLLQQRLVGQMSVLAALDTRLGNMFQVEAFLGEPSGNGLSSLLDGFFGRMAELSADPADPVLRNGAVQSAVSFTSELNQLATSLDTLRSDTFQQVELEVQRANSLAERISIYNHEIGKVEVAGAPANDLRDQRDMALRELAEVVDISYTEQASGAVHVRVGGHMLVGNNRAYELGAERSTSGDISISIDRGTNPIKVTGGSLAGLLRFNDGSVPELRTNLDELANQMIFEANRAHSTGVPRGGPFSSLTGSYELQDADGDGDVTDELLVNSGLPFDVQEGELFINVTDEATGLSTTRRIEIDPARTTVGDLLAAIDGLDHVAAGIDAHDRIQIQADPGFGFDFAPRFSGAPDANGVLGGGHASLGMAGSGPYALANGDTLDLSTPTGSFTVAFSAADFGNISAATADEIAAVLNADPNMAANGMRAVVDGERLVLQTIGEGAAATFDVVGGSALGALGLSAGTTVTGSDLAVDIQLSGSYGSDSNRRFTFVPTTDGVVGSTAGLQVQVFDETGSLVTTLDVGADYQPGTELELADGLSVSFGVGDLSATNNDSLTLDVVNDSDTSDVLVALGLNGMFVGTDARTIAVRSDLAANSDLLASSYSGTSGDNGAILALLNLESSDIAGLSDVTFGEFYGDLVSDVGFEMESLQTARDVESSLAQSLSERREQVSGVNVDEELVNMIQFEQAFAAASRFIQVVNQLNDDLLALV